MGRRQGREDLFSSLKAADKPPKRSSLGPYANLGVSSPRLYVRWIVPAVVIPDLRARIICRILWYDKSTKIR